MAIEDEEQYKAMGLEREDYVIPISEGEAEEVIRVIVNNDWKPFVPVKRRRKRRKRRKDRFPDNKEADDMIKTNTMYKPKGKKVHPRDDVPSDGTVPDGDPYWKEKKWEKLKHLVQDAGEFSQWITGKFSDIAKGERLYGERLAKLLDQVKHLTEKERELLLAILYNREAALAWEFAECGRVSPDVAPPQEIKVVEHKAWQAGSIPIPIALRTKVTEILRDRLKKGILEYSHASYRNPWFLVSKKNGDFRLINSATRYNAYTIRDALLPPGADEFSEDFAMCKILTIVDFFSGYDQVTLAEKSRDITTFSTPIGLVRMCTLPQGATNSVAQFMRIILRILHDLVPEVCRPFLDDIAVRGPTSTFDNEEVTPGIRRYVLEHLINLDKVLVNVELAGCTISPAKSLFCQAEAVIVGYLCGTNGRRPEETKIIKITEWKTCESVSDVRSFLGIVGYYRQWVEKYAIKAKPLTNLLRKNTVFTWGDHQQEAMDQLKEAVTSDPILVSLDVSKGHGEIILMVDASLTGWGAVLMQVVEGARRPVRYESGCWNEAQARYDATKRECRAVAAALKRLRNHLYGVHFTLETDALVLISQINGAANDIPGSLVLRWISYILLFSFSAKHVPGEKNTVADGLSRKPRGASDNLDEKLEGDLEDSIDLTLATVTFDQTIDESTELTDFQKDMLAVRKYPQTLQKPEGWSEKKFRRLRIMAAKFLLNRNTLFRRATLSTQNPRVVIVHEKIQEHLIKEAHLKMGHKSIEMTEKWISQRWWWRTLKRDVDQRLRSCPLCQAFKTQREADPSVIAKAPSLPMARVHFDVLFLPSDEGKRFVLHSRCDLTGWPEAKATKYNNSRSMRIFFQELTWRYGAILIAIVDNGSEAKGEFADALEDAGVMRIPISAYNSQANGIVENGHYSLTMSVAKMCFPGEKWLRYLPSALFADRVTHRRSHGMSPFFLLYGFEPILPMELEYPTWRLINWNEVRTHQELVEARIRVLARHTEDIAKAAARVHEFREQLAKRRNMENKHVIRRIPLDKGCLVLVYDIVRNKIDMSTSRKLKARWQGPFRVIKKEANNSYTLETLDQIKLPGTFASNRIKPFAEDEDGWWRGEDDEEWLAGPVKEPEMLLPTSRLEVQIPKNSLDKSLYQAL